MTKPWRAASGITVSMSFCLAGCMECDLVVTAAQKDTSFVGIESPFRRRALGVNTAHHAPSPRQNTLAPCKSTSQTFLSHLAYFP